jgi:membrane-bound ClpP family serine protease
MAAAGVVLLIVGIVLALSEAHNPSHGIAGSGGVLLIAVGTALALAGAGAGVAIGLGAGGLLAVAGGGSVAMLVVRSTAVRQRRVRGGAEGLVGEIAVVRNWTQESGRVSLHGGVWDARRSLSPLDDEDDGDLALHAGDRVVVERLNGLTLSVRPAEAWELV